MSTFNYSLNQLNDSKTYTHIQLPVKNDTSNGKIGLIQDIDIGVMQGFGYTIDGYNSDTSQINNFVSFVSTVDLLLKNLTTRITDLKTIVDGLTSESLIASIITEPKANSLTYNGTSQYLITAGSANNGVMYYSSVYDGSYSTSLPQGTNAGAYTVYYYAKGNTGYKDSAKRQLAVTIAKASSLKTAPTVISSVISHDGNLHNLINAGTTNSGTMEYGVNFNNSSTTNPPSLWTSDIPQGRDSGQYYIWYRIQNGVDSNYEAINATYLTYVTISESAVQQYTVRLIIIYGSSTTSEDKVVNSGSSATWTMQPPTGYNWPTTIENGRINGNTITSDIVNESNTDENGIMIVTVTCEEVNTDVPVTSIRLSKSSIELDANGSTTITATVKPTNASNQTVNWKSSKPTVATVTSSTTSGQNATVTWKKAGSCTITATADGDASKSATCSVTCQEVAIQQYTVKLYIVYGSYAKVETQQVNSGSSATWTMEPPTGYNWPTTIENGTISGNTITSYVVNESNTDENGIMTVRVTCVEATIAVTGMTIDKSTLTVAANGNGSISATITPPNATNQTINWKTSNASIATVVSPTTSGNSTTVIWQGAGKCTITATAADNTSIKQTCSVTCQEKQYTVTLTVRYGDNYDTYIEHVNYGESASWTMEPPAGYSWPASAYNGTINGNTITSLVVNDNNTSNGELAVTVTCVEATIAVTSIRLSPTSIELDANNSTTITAEVSPTNATNQTINWESSKPTIATVTSSTTSGQNATVTWKKAGECTITATAAGNTSISRTCKVICNAATIAVTDITLSPTSLNIAANGSKTITATIEPPNATDKTITWSSSDTAIATVTSPTTSGNSATVTWKKAGTCMIRATAAGNTSIIRTCPVTCAASVPEEPSYTWYKGTATEEQIQSQEYVNSLTYNQLTKPESDTTITLSQGYNTFMFPESWGIPIFGTDTSYNKRNEPYTVDELGIVNPEGKIFIAIESNSETTRYIKWQ